MEDPAHADQPPKPATDPAPSRTTNTPANAPSVDSDARVAGSTTAVAPPSSGEHASADSPAVGTVDDPTPAVRGAVDPATGAVPSPDDPTRVDGATATEDLPGPPLVEEPAEPPAPHQRRPTVPIGPAAPSASRMSPVARWWPAGCSCFG